MRGLSSVSLLDLRQELQVSISSQRNTPVGHMDCKQRWQAHAGPQSVHLVRFRCWPLICSEIVILSSLGDARTTTCS